jgi:biopolymer transport protein ExbB
MGLDPVETFKNASILVQIITVSMLLMSVYMFYVITERLITFHAASDQSIRYVQQLGVYLKSHKISEALHAAKGATKSPVGRVMESGLEALIRGRDALKTEGPEDVGDFDLVDSVNRALERVKERETSNLRKGLAYLGTVASATPFIGLLGTVIGILGTFQLLGGGEEASNIKTIGPKIAEALYSTGLGLAVAILGAMSFNYFTSRVEQFVIDMNDISSEFIDYVLREGRS